MSLDILRNLDDLMSSSNWTSDMIFAFEVLTQVIDLFVLEEFLRKQLEFMACWGKPEFTKSKKCLLVLNNLLKEKISLF